MVMREVFARVCEEARVNRSLAQMLSSSSIRKVSFSDPAMNHPGGELVAYIFTCVKWRATGALLGQSSNQNLA